VESSYSETFQWAASVCTSSRHNLAAATATMGKGAASMKHPKKNYVRHEKLMGDFIKSLRLAYIFLMHADSYLAQTCNL
jgi:hypothetical protein